MRQRTGFVVAPLVVAPLVAAFLGGPGPLGAATTRTEDQRLVWTNPADLPQGSQLGSTLAMGGDFSGFPPFAVAGAPTGGAAALFRYFSDTGWTHDWSILPAAVQLFPVDTDSIFGLTSRRQLDGTYSVRWWAASSGSNGNLVTGLTLEVGAVAMHGQTGGILAVGQPTYLGGRGLLRIYEEAFGNWELAAIWVGEAGERLGSSLDALEGVVVAGAPGYGANGAVYEYVRGSEWMEWQRIDSPALAPQTDAAFGATVALTPDGNWLAIGSPDVDRLTTPGAATDIGAVYLYQVSFLFWELSTLLRPPDAAEFDHFGASLATDGRSLVAGSPGRDGTVSDDGAAYVYRRAGAGWQKLPCLRLVDSAPEVEEALGSSVGVGAVGVLVGAPKFDANGVLDQGAVLVYDFPLFRDDFDGGDFSAWSEVVP